MAKKLKRTPDVISTDKPLNKKDLPPGTKISKDGLKGYYSKEYLKVLENKRTGAGIEGRNASRIEKIYRTMGGGIGSMWNPKNR